MVIVILGYITSNNTNINTHNNNNKYIRYFKQNLQFIVQFFIEMGQLKGVTSDIDVINNYAIEMNAFIVRIQKVK